MFTSKVSLYSEWAAIDQEFITFTLAKYFDLNRKNTQVLLDYVKKHPIGNGYNICGSWLQPPDRLEHYLYIDSEKGLMSQWLVGEENLAFDQEMKQARDSSLFNLKIFLLTLEDNQAHDVLLANDQKGLQLWDQRYTEKYGRLH